MPMYKINQAKTYFFDGKIAALLDENSRKGLSLWGAMTRRTVRSKLKKARQKKLSELTQEERQRFRIRQEIARRENLPKPKRPLAPSKPGEPPRMHEGLIKKFTYFTYDPESRSTVVGPAGLDRPTGAPETLEKGGYVTTKNGRARVAKRPFTKPSFDEHVGKLPRLIAGQY